jgi:hypothetical protein
VFDMVTADVLDRLAPTERQRILRVVADIDLLTVTEPTIVYAAYAMRVLRAAPCWQR